MDEYDLRIEGQGTVIWVRTHIRNGALFCFFVRYPEYCRRKIFGLFLPALSFGLQFISLVICTSVDDSHQDLGLHRMPNPLHTDIATFIGHHQHQSSEEDSKSSTTICCTLFLRKILSHKTPIIDS